MDRIALCEVYAVLAHDYGLYGIAAKLHRMGFRGRPSLAIGSTRGLDDEQYEVFLALEPRALRTDPYAMRLAR